MIHNISTSPSSLEKKEKSKDEKASAPEKEQDEPENTTTEAMDLFGRIKQLVMWQKKTVPSEDATVPDITAEENTELAKEKEIKGYSKMKKVELINALK